MEIYIDICKGAIKRIPSLSIPFFQHLQAFLPLILKRIAFLFFFFFFCVQEKTPHTHHNHPTKIHQQDNTSPSAPAASSPPLPEKIKITKNRFGREQYVIKRNFSRDILTSTPLSPPYNPENSPLPLKPLSTPQFFFKLASSPPSCPIDFFLHQFFIS